MYEIVIVDDKSINELAHALLEDATTHWSHTAYSWGYSDVKFILDMWLQKQPHQPRDKFVLE